MQKTGIIYRAYDSEGKSYVGQTVKGLDVRRKQHENINDDSVFHKALRDKGLDAFNWEVLEDNVPEEQLLERERYWAKVFDSCKNGYNGRVVNQFSRYIMRKGRPPWNKGKHHSTETKKKMSVTRKGKPTWMKGKHHSDEAKQKISESHLGKPSPMKGRQHTEESKQKNREKHLGKTPVNKGIPMTEEAKQKSRESHMGKPSVIKGKHRVYNSDGTYHYE